MSDAAARTSPGTESGRPLPSLTQGGAGQRERVAPTVPPLAPTVEGQPSSHELPRVPTSSYEPRADPVTRELVRNTLDSIADQMCLTIVRTAHSAIVKSAMDFSTALCDGAGRIIAQGLTLPNQLGAVPDAMAASLGKYRGRLEPGDVLIMNDPYEGGMHLPDIFVSKPVFVGGELVAAIATIAHHTDVGGKAPGSLAADSTEIYQEGLRIPPLKMYERGEPNEAVHEFIRANVRVPDVVLGDLGAQLAACHVGEQGIRKLIDKFGLAALRRHFDELLDHTERLTRAEIAAWPDGTYTCTDYMDDDGIHPDPIPIAVTVTVRGDSVHIDFTGSSPQIAAALNSSLSFTKSAVYYSIRSLLRADVPNNDGYFRPIGVTAPQGTIVNPVLPAATAMRGLTGFRISDAIFGALAQALPDRVPAGNDGGLSLVGIGGYDPARRPFVLVEVLSGSWGGRPDRDGIEGMPNIGANISNVPVEMIETAYPIEVEQYGFLPDTGGAGKHRGGLSMVRDYRLLADVSLTIRSDRRRFQPYGLAGGRPGTPSDVRLNPATENRQLPGKFTMDCPAGTTFRHVLAGAGGHGDPLDRDPAAVLRDVRGERITVDYAHREYGVLVDLARMAVDEEATAALRAARRSGL
ncbi:MAG: hydantoinase B/oxoprolinase family protein [Chloroflexi bacterium]|nr:hydantoinase B/oxoprolinase family protein [Chloroflexota bacterium]